jgi:hypothetical protein
LGDASIGCALHGDRPRWSDVGKGFFQINEDDHENFDQPESNFTAAVREHVSWGWFDYRRQGESGDEGYRTPSRPIFEPPSGGPVAANPKKQFPVNQSSAPLAMVTTRARGWAPSPGSHAKWMSVAPTPNTGQSPLGVTWPSDSPFAP